MAQPFPPRNVEAHIQGEISGQVAVGNYILQIGSVHGGVVNFAPPEQQPRPRPRPTPVFLRPRPFPGLLDREAEVGAASASLQSATPVEFHGEAGLGKTTLLRHLAHHPPDTPFPDGVIYLSARHQPVADLLQSLFDAFYESDTPFKPTDAQVRHALQGKQALILLDDVDLARDEVEALMDAAPGCPFLLASPERRLWGEGHAVALRGLPSDDALTLVERELGRPLTSEERTSAQALCTALEGHPLRILQASAMAREEGRSLAEVAHRTQTPSPAEALTTEALDSLPKPERQVLAALAALGGAPLRAEHLAALTGLADAVPVLETLMRRGLVQAHSPRYSLAGALGEDLQQMWDLTPWAERALAHFATWAEGHQSAPDRLLEEADAVLQVVGWGGGAGRWAEVLRLGRAVEGALVLGRRWGAWAQVLQWVLQAARALGDRAAEAWTLHQLGSRALCLGRAEEARASFSQALRMREAIGDRAGAAVTRHNLNLLPGAPPAPPRKPPAPKAGPSPAVWLIPLAGVVIGVSLLIGIVITIRRPTPTSPPPPPPPLTSTPTLPPPSQPRVNIRLEDGCHREYNYGDQTRLLVEANVEGSAEIRLDDEFLEEIWLTPEEPWHRLWTFEDVEPGKHQFWVVLSDESGELLAENGCPFALIEEPSQTTEVSIWLTEGCEQEYEPSFPTEVFFQSSVDGLVNVYLVNPEGGRKFLFGEEVQAGQDASRDWEVPEWEGNWALEADLNDGLASGRCDFSVETELAPPVIGDIWIEPVVGESVCPEDKVYVYVRVSDEIGLGRVEIRARYPAGSGSWVPAEMWAVDDQTYQHPLTAHAEPGTEFYIYAEDPYGDSAKSGVQVYAVEPCVTILYDFVERAFAAQWTNIGEDLPWNGSTSDERGFARWQDNVLLEDGSQPERVLETHPEWVEGGMIWGEYEETAKLDIQAGDRLVLTVGFMSGAQAGDVLFQVRRSDCHPMDPDCSGQRKVVEIQDNFNSQLVRRVVPLEESVGESGWFWLGVYAGESSAQDWAVWVEARIERP
jgi:hypothetical protein